MLQQFASHLIPNLSLLSNVELLCYMVSNHVCMYVGFYTAVVANY